MISVVNVQQMLHLEAEAEAHLPEHALMRTAAFGMYVEILNILRMHYGSAQGCNVVGLIGPGNNGSDALWAMSLLSQFGLSVSAIDTTQKRKPGFVDQLYTSGNGKWQSFEDMPDSIDLIIDGIAGLRNNLAPSDTVLDFVTAHPESLVVAVDMPSCFDNDSATLIDTDRVIAADYTITFGYLKPCHVFNPARSLCGDVILVELPLAQVPEPVGQLMEPRDVPELLTELDTQSNKYSHGVLGLIAGSRKYPGAGVLTVLGSQWGGSGYIQHLGSRESAFNEMNVISIDSLQSMHPKTNVIVCGPGIDQLDGSINLLREIVLLDKTLLLDADAITLLSQSDELQSLLVHREALTILTPHHGEALRLAESLAIDTSDSEHVWVSKIARTLKVLVAYKSAHGFIALPDGTFFFSDTTASSLATAGTGDVLAGLMGSLIARHDPTTHRQLAHIAMGAVILHSLAAQLSEEISINATAFDIAHQIRNAISILQKLGEE